MEYLEKYVGKSFAISMIFFFVLSLCELEKTFFRPMEYSSSNVFIRLRSSFEKRMHNGENTSVTIYNNINKTCYR